MDARVTGGEFAAWADERARRMEQALAQWLPGDAPAGLGDAMRYAALSGGKRLRPLLVLAAAEAVDGNPRAALRAACAVELIHSYSLVHDDLPCMDNDVLRRGKPTAHVQFGEAQALLAGDALQALAFELLTAEDEAVPAGMQVALCRLLARAAGADGMAGGQAIDLASTGMTLTLDQLRHMHELKTGALLAASVRMGVACSNHALPPMLRSALDDYGKAVGLAFQVVDDILDASAETARLGKTAGKDAASGKPTYVSLLGLHKARQLAWSLRDDALRSLDAVGCTQSGILRELACRVVERES